MVAHLKLSRNAFLPADGGLHLSDINKDREDGTIMSGELGAAKNHLYYSAVSPDTTSRLGRLGRLESFAVGCNFKVIGKCEASKLSYPGAFIPTSLNMAGLAAHISKGHPWMPAVLDTGAKRWQQHANFAEVLGADIDGGLAIGAALRNPFIKNHAGLLIESASSKADHNKFRLVFRLPRAAEGWKTIRILNRYLIELLGVADKSCKDASRFFFGAPGRSPHLINEEATLPETFIEEAIAWDAEIEAKAQREYELALTKRRENTADPRDLQDLVEKALNFIPPRVEGQGTYETCITVLFALYSEFGEGAIAIAERWSPSHGQWNIPKKIKGFARGGGARPITLGSLFYIAKQNGFDFPEFIPDPDYYKKHPEKSKRIIGQINRTAIANPLETQVQGTRKTIWGKQVFSFDADQEFDDEFLDIEKIKAAIAPDTWLLSIKAPLGSGKTHALNGTEFVEGLLDFLENSGRTQGYFFPTYRNTLALNLTNRIKRLYHLNFHDGHLMVGDTHGRLVACIDSLLKLPTGYFKGRGIVLDEANSILHHLTTSTTLNGKRRAVIAKCAEMIRDAAFVLSLDGNLTNRDIEYIKSLRGVTDNQGIVNLRNKTQPKDTPVTLIASFKQTPSIAKLDEILPIAIAENKTIVVISDSQRLLEKLHEKYAKILPAKEIIRIDSKTCGDKQSGAKEYMENPTRLPILLLLSPSAETGFNCDNSKFDIPQVCGYVFGFFNGTISPGSALQLSRRVRHAERMFIQCNPYAKLQSGYSTAKEFKENQALAIDLDAIDHADYANQILSEGSNDPTYGLLADHMVERSYTRANTFECLVEMFRHHGYSPELIDDSGRGLDEGSEARIKSEMKEAASIIQTREAQGILDAAELTQEMARAYKDSYDLSPEKRLQLERYIIKERLPGVELDPAWWCVDGLIEIRKAWRALEAVTINVHSKNLDKARVANSQKWDKWIEADRFLGDCGKAVYAKAEFFHSLKLDALPEFVSKDSPELREFFRAAKNNKKKFKALLGIDLSRIDIDKADLISLFRRIIQPIGLKLESGRKFNQARHYKIAPLEGVIKLFFEKTQQTLETQAAGVFQHSTKEENSIEEKPLVECVPAQNTHCVRAVTPPSPPPQIGRENLRKYDRLSYQGHEAIYLGSWCGDMKVFLPSLGRALYLPPAHQFLTQKLSGSAPTELRECLEAIA